VFSGTDEGVYFSYAQKPRGSIGVGVLGLGDQANLGREPHGLIHLASNDADFDRVPGITRYAPV
jgi:hypothetical protein